MRRLYWYVKALKYYSQVLPTRLAPHRQVLVLLDVQHDLQPVPRAALHRGAERLPFLRRVKHVALPIPGEDLREREREGEGGREGGRELATTLSLRVTGFLSPVSAFSVRRSPLSGARIPACTALRGPEGVACVH